MGITVLVALGVDFHEAEMGMLMLAFILFLGLFLWAFSAGSLKWVWVMLVGGAGLMTGMAWLLQGVLI
ncbi:hypothetical protein CKO35_12055 [Ectothiorhodospira shaposhnikovii]|uniref:hypothetical protein n=1 Tax=Ectothiorhodospira shaposhnikovii TaxID=1054 RepID=UPI001907D8A1|nr:hypothetical protein [Ectothiorhodospira shaposhnikovii]MBK1674029.1 hypothetical protein [Ectothiorhodospira shaposhnikovii]